MNKTKELFNVLPMHWAVVNENDVIAQMERIERAIGDNGMVRVSRLIDEGYGKNSYARRSVAFYIGETGSAVYEDLVTINKWGAVQHDLKWLVQWVDHVLRMIEHDRRLAKQQEAYEEQYGHERY